MSQRICYIGAGNFSSIFVHPQLDQHDIELAAICDIVEEKARTAAARFGFKRVYTDFEKMLDEQQPDAVFCVGSKNMHYLVGMRVLERSLPLYVQKPPADAVEQVREMAQTAARHGTVCHVGFNLRSAPAVQFTRRLLESDEFGAPTLLIFRYGLFSSSDWEYGIRDQHSHAVDTMYYLLGRFEDLHVQPLLQEGVRGYVATMRTPNGAVATLNTVSEQDMRHEFIYFELTGRGGHYVTSHDGDLYYHRPDGENVCIRAGTYYPNRLLDHLGYVEDVRNFLAAARGEELDRCPVADTITTMELLAEIYRQCRERGVDR